METKLLSTDTLKLYEQRFKTFSPNKKPMSQTDKEIVDIALKRFNMWIETYEERLIAEREYLKVKTKEDENKTTFSVNDFRNEEERKTRDEELKKEVDEGLRTIITINSWWECLIWAQSKNPSRQIRRSTYNKLLKGGFYNRKVQETINDAVKRLSLI